MRKSILAMLLLALAGLPSAAQPTAPYFTDVSGDAGLTGIVPYRISVGDLNGDGYPDILMHTEPNHAAGDVLDKQFLLLNEPGTIPAIRSAASSSTTPPARAFGTIAPVPAAAGTPTRRSSPMWTTTAIWTSSPAFTCTAATRWIWAATIC